MPEFGALPLPVNLALFAAAAAVVWLAGTRVAGYASTIAERTGIGKAVVGALLLGGITSLPEVATTGTAAASGNAYNTPDNLAAWIRRPDSVEPGTVMPTLGVSEQDARDIAGYLYTLK